VTFNVEEYDPKETLIIDPSVIFSTFTGSKADNWGYTATPGLMVVFLPEESLLQPVTRCLLGLISKHLAG
jgi:hypothetical protein